jgi:hypothetical protein
LLAPEQRSGVEEKLAQLGVEIAVLQESQLSAGIGAAFIKIGGLLVQLKAEQEALKAIRKAGPAIQEVFGSKLEAIAIGSSPNSGVRGTVRASWTQILARIESRSSIARQMQLQIVLL